MSVEQTEQAEKIAAQLADMTTMELIERVWQSINHPEMVNGDQLIYDKDRITAALMVLNYAYLRIADEWNVQPANRGFAN
jgi:hypothetical protein